MTNYKVWGVHMGVHVSDRPIEGGYIAVGWPELGDLGAIETTRDAFKKRLEAQRSQKLESAGVVCIGRRGTLDIAALEALLGPAD